MAGMNAAAFSGCGDEKGTGIFREDIKDAIFDKRAVFPIVSCTWTRSIRNGSTPISARADARAPQVAEPPAASWGCWPRWARVLRRLSR